MATKRSRHSRSKTHGSSNTDEEESGSGSDYDLDKDLHPLNHYLNDREEMINQVFKVIKGRKLRAMLTSGLRDLDTKELKSLCLTQLEGMSKRRIKYILAGREMDESSATDDSEEEDDDEQLEQDDQGMASGPLVDDIQTSLLNRKTPDDEAKEEPIEIKDSDEEAVEDEEEEDEELNDIIERRTKDLTKKAKLDLQLVKKTKGTKAPEPEDKQKIMELLELEMRARAIKSLLSKTKKGDKSLDPPTLENKDNIEDEDEKVELIKEPVDPEEEKRQLEEQKRLHKAREALSISNAKKRKEEQELERKREEIKKRIEEREAKKKAEAEALRKKEEAEAEKKRKKEEREAEYQRYLKWKETKLEKEMESQALAKQEKDQRTKDSLKAKKAELEAKEEMKKAEKEANAETIKKTKIQRETVDDELQCDFEVTFDVDDDDDDEGEPIANDQGTSEPNKRRYRRKGDAEEGEIDDHEGSRSRSPSRSRSKSRSYSRSRSRSRSETTLSDSEDEANIERLREKRKERLRDIKEQKRVTKSASEVDEGEVDSEGEDFKIIEDTEQSEVKVDNEELMEPINPNEPKEHTEPLEPKVLLEPKKPLEPKEPLEPNEPVEAKDESDTKHEDMSFEKQEINKGTELIPEEVSSEQVEPFEVTEEKLESVEPEEVKEDIDIDKEEEPMEVQDSESVLESDSQDPQSSSAMTSSQPSPLINETDSQDSIKVSKKRRKAWTRQVPNPQESEELVQEEEPDYVFKTKRQLLHEREHAPEEPVEVEDEEELERQKEAEKIKEKRQKQMEMRLKRMQAFQERSEIKEDEQEGDFYKSYHEAEEERLRIEQEAAQAAQDAVQAAQESELEQPEKPQYIEITKDEPTKDPEVSEKEGVAYWTKMIDDDDDVEVPKPGSPAKIKKGSRDLPSKAQVDAHQAEQETWADRWYQNKKVQKVVQDSKIYSKVKANIKTKFVKPIEAIEESLRPGTSAKDLKAEAIRRKLNKNPQNTALPVIGSLDEYSKIKTSEPLETKSDSSDDDSSDEGDGLWSAIMGKD